MGKKRKERAPVPADATSAVTSADARRDVTNTHVQSRQSVENARKFSKENKL